MYFNPTNSSAAGGVIIYNKPTSSNTDNSRIFFRQYSYSSSDLNTRTGYYENYFLPKTVRGLTANGSYEIITSKGGTTTGKLYLANGSGVHGTDAGWTSIGFYGTSKKLRGSLMLSDSNRFHFNQQETGVSYAERYLLPGVTTGLTGDVWYNILTSKHAVTIPQGGTGATTAAAARTALGITPANIGALPSSGGTLTGTASTILSLNTTHANNFIYIKSNDVSKVSIGYYNGLACIANEATLARIGVNDSGTPQYWSNATANTAKTLLHEGNYGSYIEFSNLKDIEVVTSTPSSVTNGKWYLVKQG